MELHHSLHVISCSSCQDLGNLIRLAKKSKIYLVHLAKKSMENLGFLGKISCQDLDKKSKTSKILARNPR